MTDGEPISRSMAVVESCIKDGWTTDAVYLTSLFSKSSKDVKEEINQLIQEEAELEHELTRLTAQNHHRLLQSVLNFNVIENNVSKINGTVREAVVQTDPCGKLDRTLTDCARTIEKSLTAVESHLNKVDVVQLERFFLLPILMEISWRENNWKEFLNLAIEQHSIRNRHSEALQSIQTNTTAVNTPVKVSTNHLNSHYRWIERSVRTIINLITSPRQSPSDIDSTEQVSGSTNHHHYHHLPDAELLNILVDLLSLIRESSGDLSTILSRLPDELFLFPKSIPLSSSDKSSLIMVECFLFRLASLDHDVGHVENPRKNNTGQSLPAPLKSNRISDFHTTTSKDFVSCPFTQFISSAAALTELLEAKLQLSTANVNITDEVPSINISHLPESFSLRNRVDQAISNYVQFVVVSVSNRIRGKFESIYGDFKKSSCSDWLRTDFSESNATQQLLDTDESAVEPTTTGRASNRLPPLSTLSIWLEILTRLNRCLTHLQGDAGAVIIDPVVQLCEHKILCRVREIYTQLQTDIRRGELTRTSRPSSGKSSGYPAADVSSSDPLHISPLEFLAESQRILLQQNIVPLIHWTSAHLALLNECRDIVMALGPQNLSQGFAKRLANCMYWSGYHCVAVLTDWRHCGRGNAGSQPTAEMARTVVNLAWHIGVSCVVLATAMMLGQCRHSLTIEFNKTHDDTDFSNSLFTVLGSDRRSSGDSKVLYLDALGRRLLGAS